MEILSNIDKESLFFIAVIVFSVLFTVVTIITLFIRGRKSHYQYTEEAKAEREQKRKASS